MPLALLLLTLTTSHAHPHHHRRVYAAGSGSMFKSQPDTVREVIALSGVGDHRTPSVLYLGTATYDDPAPMHSQTSGFADVGCAVSALDVAVRTPPASEMAAALAAADIIVISGGNTLFAVDRWVATGLDGALRNALARGVVLCGGSAGFISLCDGGHSDSMQPDSYKNPPGPLLNASLAMRPAVNANWAYTRVPGLGVLGALCCPHYDSAGSNGVARAADFTAMLRAHSGEHGIGIDNYAALSVDGDHYTVVSRKRADGSFYPGSVLPDGSFSANRTGVPGAWRLRVSAETGVLERTLVAAAGHVDGLLTPPRYIALDTQIAVARGQNPDDGEPPSWVDSRRANVYGNPEWWL